MADLFDDRLKSSLSALRQDPNPAPRIDLPAERCVLGFDAYARAIDAAGKGGVVLLATRRRLALGGCSARSWARRR
jgi:hypothetical protein